MDKQSSESGIDTMHGSSDTGSSCYQSYTEMTAEQEFFLYELETTDSNSMGLVLRAIYDCGDVNKFTRALEHRIQQYNKNIERVCTFHYKEFVESMKVLLELRKQCDDIKNKSVTIDEEIQRESIDIAKKNQEILKYRKLIKNATTAMYQVSSCLPMLENYAKLYELMSEKKYYQALKVLEELDHTHLALSEKYRFTQTLANSMGPIRQQIKQEAYSEFKDFLEHIKKVAGRVGRHASRDIARQHSFGGEPEKGKLDHKTDRPEVEIAISSDGSIIRKQEKHSIKSKSPTKGWDAEALSAQDLIDYTPIHRCCQIFTVLGNKEEFEQYFRLQRKEQCQVVIEPPTKMSSLKSYVDYLNEIIGFFVVEDHISMTETSLAANSHKNQLWDEALKKVINTMNTRFGGCPDVEMMLRIKKVILLFALTMKSYSFVISPLYLLLQNFRDQYNEILMSEYCAQFEKELVSDNYTSLIAENEKEFNNIVKLFPLNKRSLENSSYPRYFPFSNLVVNVYTQAKSYLVGCMRFMEHLQLTQSEIDDTVRRYANVLLSRWSGSIKDFAARQKSLATLIQLTINISYLEKACKSLGTYVTALTTGAEGTMTTTSHQLSISERVLSDSRIEVEQLIEECIRDKIDEILELGRYDWELPASSGQASDHITDLIKFLSTTFSTFAVLPQSLSRHVCMQTCKHLSDRLSDTVLQPDVQAVSPGALEQFSLDVMQCEMFTMQAPVEGFEKNALAMTFVHLRQLLDLVMHSDWATYIAEYGQESAKYSRVKATVAITFLEKMIEFEKKNTGFFGINKGDRKKLLDTILRQLRLLAHQ